MRVAQNARCSFRSSPARQNSNRNLRFTGFELSCRKQTTKQFSSRYKTPFLCPPRRNGFPGLSSPVITHYLNSFRSYPFALSRKAVRPRLSGVLPLEIAPRRLG
jgi:hypothetical protein